MERSFHGEGFTLLQQDFAPPTEATTAKPPVRGGSQVLQQRQLAVGPGPGAGAKIVYKDGETPGGKTEQISLTGGKTAPSPAGAWMGQAEQLQVAAARQQELSKSRGEEKKVLIARTFESGSFCSPFFVRYFAAVSCRGPADSGWAFHAEAGV